MLKNELKNLITDKPNEKATAMEIAVDAYETAHSTAGFVVDTDPTEQELIKTINDILPGIKDPQDAKDLIDLKTGLEKELIAYWIRKREAFYSMKAVIENLTDIDYRRYRNYKSGLIKLDKYELIEIKKAMKAVARDNFKGSC